MYSGKRTFSLLVPERRQVIDGGEPRLGLLEAFDVVIAGVAEDREQGTVSVRRLKAQQQLQVLPENFVLLLLRKTLQALYPSGR